MRKQVPTAIMLFLTACGGAAIATNNIMGDEADAQSRRNNSTKSILDDEIALHRAVNRGGPVNCFDPRMTGRERAVMEHAGGVPCDSVAQGQSAGAAGGDGWTGRYGGRFDGGQGLVNISRPTGARTHQVEVEVVGDGGCSGSARGVANATGNRMSLEIPTQNNQGLCAIDLVRSGGTLRVTESDCAELHGMSCGFDGSVTRVGQTASANPPRAAAASSSWIVGAWVFRGEGCQGDSGITLRADGSYGTGNDNGRWSLAGNALTLLSLERSDGDGPGNERRVRNPRPVTHQIITRAANAYSVRYANGQVVHMVRCR